LRLRTIVVKLRVDNRGSDVCFVLEKCVLERGNYGNIKFLNRPRRIAGLGKS